MPRRAVDTDTLDLFGFDPVGRDYITTAEESELLLGLGALALAVYHVLKRFARQSGKVTEASYWRLAQVLMHRQAGAGRPIAPPTQKQLRTAVQALCERKLIYRKRKLNESNGVLQIFVRSPGWISPSE